jgi:hypothetical protein
VPLAYAGKRALFRCDPLAQVAVLVTRDRRELALEPFIVKPLPPVDPGDVKRGSGRLQRLLDDWRGTPRANAEPAFGIPEVFQALAQTLGRPVPASEREASDVQTFWRTHGPIERVAFVRACTRARSVLGEGRPLATLLADITRQIADDNDASPQEVLA